MDNQDSTVPTQCSAVKRGGYVVIKGKPCKVIETSTSKTGKHGHAKVHLVGSDIFTNKKYEEISPSTHTLQVPVIQRQDYMLLYISDDGYASLLTKKNVQKDDIKVPEGEIGDSIRAMYDAGDEAIITVLASMGQEHIVAAKKAVY